MERWNRRVRRTCVGVILLALLLRLGAAAPWRLPRPKAWRRFSCTCKPAGPPARSTARSPRRRPPRLRRQFRRSRSSRLPCSPSPPRPGGGGTDLSAGEAAEVELKYGGSYRPDVGGLLDAGGSGFSGDSPRILIVHTHATESYTMEAGWEYSASSDYRTLDPRLQHDPGGRGDDPNPGGGRNCCAS